VNDFYYEESCFLRLVGDISLWGASQAPNPVSCDGRNISLSLDMQHHYKLNTYLNIDEENLPALAEITFTGCKQ